MFSLIAPTRGRTAELRRMMDSIRLTAQDPASIELILVMDQDDRESLDFLYTGLNAKRVVVPPGQTMGSLNLAGYRAATGRYLMLLNDDVEARTPGWDAQLKRLLEGYRDGVVLVHVNDLILRDRLCTFPVMTREFCELAGGICPPEYRRYRIDDHLHHVFDLIFLMGYARRVYVPEVVFEHHNGAINRAGLREYVPEPATHQADTECFKTLAGQRRDLALACIERIEGSLDAAQRAAKMRVLEDSGDPILLRRREHARWWRDADPASNARIQAAVVADSPAQAQRSLASIEAAWPGLPAMVVPRHNQALRACGADYLVVLESNAAMPPGWIEKALDAMSRPGTMVIAPGVVVIDVPRFGHLRFNEAEPDVLDAYLEGASAAGARVVDSATLDRASPEGATPEISRIPVGRNRLAFWALNAPPMLAARFPFLAQLGIGLAPALFDPAWYRSTYPSVAGAGNNPLLHYLKRGGFEGYKPNPHFDSSWYLETNPDVAASGINPLVHFARYGAREGRSPNLFFDVRYYEKENPEVASLGMNPLEHFIARGVEQGRSPCASLSITGYFARIRSRPRRAKIEVHDPAPLSVLIPTRGRRDRLARTLAACQRRSAGCALEFIVIDDGSDDGTPDLLRHLSTQMPNLRWQSTPPQGPAVARNLAASKASHDVLLFLGDDVVPADEGFFYTHAQRHSENPQRDFAVLGKVARPEEKEYRSPFMTFLEDDGAQFAFRSLKPGSFVSWRYLYASNLSLKKALVGNWIEGGFDSRFPGAALEDIEFGYRLSQARNGLRIYYDPGSRGLHYHLHTVSSFLERQHFAGRSLRHLLELHPELLDDYAARAVDEALQQPRGGDSRPAAQFAGSMNDLRNYACLMEARGELGKEEWHRAFLSALFEMSLHEGYACVFLAKEANLAAAREVMLKRFFSRMRRAPGRFRWPQPASRMAAL